MLQICYLFQELYEPRQPCLACAIWQQMSWNRIKKIFISQEYLKRCGEKSSQFVRGTFDFISDFRTPIQNSYNIFHVMTGHIISLAAPFKGFDSCCKKIMTSTSFVTRTCGIAGSVTNKPVAQPPTKTTFSLRLPSRLATIAIIWIFKSLLLIMVIPSVL